jgi:aryl-alcohol dehydrogenase-like predicted oxidoreductase
MKEIILLSSFLSLKSLLIRFQVSKLGIGCMGLTGVHNSTLFEEAGIEKGITFFDTDDVYGPKTNENFY